MNLRRQGGQSGEGAFPVSLAKKSERVSVFGEHALILMATPHKARLTALHAIYVQIFRHIAQKSLAIRKVCLRNFYAICRPKNLTTHLTHKLCAVLPYFF
ncbi:hypothetical protein [Ruminococcus callidus]|uniref:hypothetical protein n=1 Tax=Ruminococcus callidus TaxID=40519 RepID=UPI000424D459|nr:hypothetical protein [Ruminococcus callidus]